MIRVTVELVSAIHSSRSKILGIAEIANDGRATITSGGQLGDYSVRLSKWAPNTEQLWKRGVVRGFDRVKRGPWDLLYVALRAVVGARNQV